MSGLFNKIDLPDLVGAPDTSEALYSPDAENWFVSLPYTFVYTKGSQKKEFPLPINPSNIVITTHFATNVISTIYGTVEEHTDIRYFDIAIEGTTGFAPRYFSAMDGGIGDVTNVPDLSTSVAGSILGKAQGLLTGKTVKGPTIGRASFQVTGPALGGLFSKTLGTATGALNQISDLIGGTSNPSGIEDDQSGYIAFHNLYRFLMIYKKTVSNPKADPWSLTAAEPWFSVASTGFSTINGSNSQHPLQFVNYKDGNQYDIAIKNFTLKRSAENPMLYFYSITMRGYNIRSPDQVIPTDDDAAILAGLGLDGINGSSTLGRMKKIAGKTRSAAGSLLGGINVFGR